MENVNDVASASSFQQVRQTAQRVLFPVHPPFPPGDADAPALIDTLRRTLDRQIVKNNPWSGLVLDLSIVPPDKALPLLDALAPTAAP